MHLQLSLTQLSTTGATPAASNDMGSKRGASHSWDGNAHRKNREEQGKCRASPQKHVYLPLTLSSRKSEGKENAEMELLWILSLSGQMKYPDSVTVWILSKVFILGFFIFLCQEEGKTENATPHPQKNPPNLNR